MKNVRLGNDLRIYFKVIRLDGLEDLSLAENLKVTIPSIYDEDMSLVNSFELKDSSTLDILVKAEDLVLGEYRVVVSYTKENLERDPSDEPFEVDNGTFKVVRYSGEVGGANSSRALNTQQMILIGEVAKNCDGTSPYIGENGNWYVGSNDTGVSATIDNFDYSIFNDPFFENLLAYGIQFDTTDPSPECKRIGSMTLHASLPIQSKIRGCLLNDDGEVVEYLPEDSWLDSTRDGSMGQVMVEIPTHYRKFVTDGTIRQVWISEVALDGYHEVSKFYVSAYKCTLERSTEKLASVANRDVDYRGGKNLSTYDSNTTNFWSGLGKPVVSTPLEDFRTYAKNRNPGDGNNWRCISYLNYKDICWLFVVEYATLNSQASVNHELTSNGFRQGGLGDGVTTLSYSEFYTFSYYQPIFQCGSTDEYGNGSGEVLLDVSSASSTLKNFELYQNRYRGLDSFFGETQTIVDGLYAEATSSSETVDPLTAKLYMCSDPNLFSSTDFSGYEYYCDLPYYTDYITNILFGDNGDLIPVAADSGSSSTYFCDAHTSPANTTVTALIGFGGWAYRGDITGIFSIQYSVKIAASFEFGTVRMCYIP